MLGPANTVRAELGRRAAAGDALRAPGALRWCALLTGAALSLSLALGIPQQVGAHRAPAPVRTAGPARHARADLSSLPVPAQGPISQALGKDDRAYHVTASGDGLVAANPAQQLAVRFGRSAVAVSSRAARASLRLSAVGYGPSLSAVGEASPRMTVNRVLYSYPDIQEWYANGPAGLEQGFIVQRASSARRAGPLTISMALSGNVEPSLASDGQSVLLARKGGGSLRYTGLTATDARGRALHAAMALEHGQLRLLVDTRAARFPVRIDPFIQQGEKLVGTGTIGTASQGFSVALSSEGSTALIGGPEDRGDAGAAWVFTRSGTTWSQQAKLVATGETGAAQLGSSVALSSNGSIALIGGPGNNANAGATWVFTRTGTTWTQQGEKLVGAGGEGASEQGFSVALSSEGTTALIGAPDDSEGTGAVWAFTRSGEKWTQQGEKLIGVGTEGKPAEGTSVALSAEGTTALIGGPNDAEGAGATWVFSRTGTTWAQQGEKLVGSGAAGAAGQGSSVALSSTGGNFALVGGPNDSSGAGATWVFARSGTTWSQQGAKLVGSGASGTTAHQGHSVALSSEGTTALIGGPGDSTEAGATWVFTRSGTTWSQQGSKLVGTGGVGKPQQGLSVALGGETALIGGPEDNGEAGAAWVFTRSGTSWSQQGSKLVGTGALGNAFQGFSVALSSEGTTALVGGPSDGAAAGAVWVFTRSGTTWSQQTKLVGTGATGMAAQGYSVALAANGSTALIGGPADNTDAGAAWVFTRSGTTWSQQGSKLVGSGATGSAFQGASVALSAEGNTALIGGPEDNSNAGATWVFTRSGTTWSQQGSKLVGTGAVGAAAQGSEVSLSSEGTTALIGGPEDNTSAGAAWVFTRSGTTWSQQGSKLVGSGGVGTAEQGLGVALSGEGTTALLGGPDDNAFTGAAWVFTRSGTTWSQQGSKLVGSGAVGAAEQGHGVALSSNGNTALVGGPNDNKSTGAAWVFTRSGTTWSQEGSKLVGSGAVGAARQGSSVALAANGTTALLGGPEDNGGAGAAWPFALMVTAPAVVTKPASGITSTTATLNATVNPDGAEVKPCTFEYGTTPAYGQTAPCSALPGSGENPVAVSAAVSGLTTNATYHFRIVATNSAGTGQGSDETFTAANLRITTASLPAAELDSSYSQTLAVSGGSAPYHWTISSGSLPAGLSLSEGGAIAGKPSAAGESSFTVKVTDSSTPTPQTATANLSIAVTQPTFATSLTNYANAEAKLGQPNAVAVDPSSQNVWVAESAQDRVLEFNAARKYLRQFGGAGSGEGQFEGIGGVAVNRVNDVYVLDTGNHRIQEFSKEGKYITQFPAGSATAIAVDSEGTEGNVWVYQWAPLSGAEIEKFSPAGAPLGQFGSLGSAPGQLGIGYGLAISGSDIYVAELGRAQEFSISSEHFGEFLGAFDEKGSGSGQSNLPWGIATNPSSGNVLVSEVGSDRVQEFSPERAFITSFGSPGSGAGQLSNPQGVAVNSSGTIYVADSANGRIQEWAAGEPPTFATSLTNYETAEATLGQPNAVAVDPSTQNLWVTESAQDRVLQFSAARKYLRQFGEAGTGQGQFQGIGGIAVNKLGDVYVLDTGNHRIQEFSKEGKYITQFPAGGATAIAIDSEGTEGNVWAYEWAPLSGAQIAKFSPAGTPLTQFGSLGSEPGQLGIAYGLAISGSDIYVAELGRAQEFSIASGKVGEFLGEFDEKGSGSGQSNLPWGIAADPTSGNVLISEVGSDRVQEFSPERAFIMSFGSPGAGNAQLSDPQALAVNSSGTIYVADSANGRVSEWVQAP